jgi:tol-pal system protein YbgF
MIKGAPPPSYQKNEIDNKLEAIEERQNVSAKQVSDLFIQNQTLTSEFQALTGRFDEISFFSEKSSAELLQSKDLLIAKVNELEQAREDLNRQLAEIKQEVTAIQQEEKKREEERIRATEAEKARKAAEKKVKKTKAAGTKASDAKIKDIYMAGYQALREGNPAEARAKFTSVLKDYSENQYSDNARFWLGETYYKEGNYEDAILSYEELFKNNPKSDKIPGAMLKQGLAFYSLNDKKTGKIILEKLIEKYPDSEPAKLAKKKITKPLPPKKKK